MERSGRRSPVGDHRLVSNANLLRRSHPPHEPSAPGYLPVKPKDQKNCLLALGRVAAGPEPLMESLSAPGPGTRSRPSGFALGSASGAGLSGSLSTRHELSDSVARDRLPRAGDLGTGRRRHGWHPTGLLSGAPITVQALHHLLSKPRSPHLAVHQPNFLGAPMATPTPPAWSTSASTTSWATSISTLVPAAEALISHH